MGYTKHIHAALAFSWVVASSKPQEAFVLPSSIFFESSSNSTVCSILSLTMWRQSILSHMELISIDSINSVRIKSLVFSPTLGWSGSRGWMSTKTVNHRHRVPPPPWNPIWKVSSPVCCIPRLSGADTGMVLTPLLEPIPVLLPKTCIQLIPSHPEGDSDARVGVLPWSSPSQAPWQKSHPGGGPSSHGSHRISTAILSPSALCWIITLQSCKITRKSAYGKEKKNMNRNTISNI